MFATSAVALLVATLALALAPVRVSVPVAAAELAVVLCGLAVLLGANLLMLRRAFRPLEGLARAMWLHDLLTPGVRARVSGDPSVAALAHAFNEMLERLERERRDSARRALLVQEAERQRIARELHDEVGQTLTGVMLQVEGIAPSVPDELHEQLDELRGTARHGTEEVREIARRLRPEALEDLGLHSALAALATGFSKHAGVAVDRRLECGRPLSKEEELVIYRVAQEALTNVARHAPATHVELRLECRNEHTNLIVRDNCRGLRPDALSSSHGIRGMRERAMLIGADFAIASPPGTGTEVRLAIPDDR